MKRRFGTIINRMLWGGTSLTELEHFVVEALIASLPASLRSTVEAQLDGYNLVHRERDGRALNFYRKFKGHSSNMDGLPLLEMNCEEARLVGVKFRLTDIDAQINATMTAVRGRVFCVSFDRALNTIKTNQPPIIENVRQSWRSSFLNLEASNNALASKPTQRTTRGK